MFFFSVYTIFQQVTDLKVVYFVQICFKDRKTDLQRKHNRNENKKDVKKELKLIGWFYKFGVDLFPDPVVILD